MKKLFVLFLLAFTGTIFSQNLQLHYDFGKDREYLTSTIEMFKPDEYGATFFFVDFDYNRGGNKSMSLAYFEIARYVNVFDKLSVTAQYNDGMVGNFNLGHVWLGGLSYPIDLGFVTLSTDILFRKDYTSANSADAQLTTVWYVPFLNNKVAFTGFLDVWTTKFAEGADTKVVLLTEPQIWVNVWNHLAVGTEIEISNNFVPGSNKVEVMPTLAAKWSF